VPPFALSCLAYLSVAVPMSSLGLLWPSMRLSLREPVGALGILLIFGVAASVLSSAGTGRLLSRRPGLGPVLTAGTMLTAVALAAEATAPLIWVFAAGVAVFGLGFGAIDSALNVYAARHFGARQINWMHASYGLGATAGPLLVTVLLGAGLGWRWTYGSMAIGQAAVAGVLLLACRVWDRCPRLGLERGRCQAAAPPPSQRHEGAAEPPAPAEDQALAQAGARERPKARGGAGRGRAPGAAVVIASAFAAVETGVESAAGIWGYLFLTAGRGLSPGVAGVAVAAYWATMFAGRAVLGPVAERAGAAQVLAGAVTGVAGGAGLMTVPGPGVLAVAGLMVLGLAAAPIFPLLTLTTGDRMGPRGADMTQAVGVQVAASAVGGTLLPSGIGLAVGASDAGVVAPSLFVLGLAMVSLYRLLPRVTQPGSR
jgi:fucose permease